MLEFLLVLVFLGIAVNAVRQVRRDPRFTPRVIRLHIAVLVVYFVYAGFGAYAIVRLSAHVHGSPVSDGAVTVWVAVFLAWLGFGLWMLLRVVRWILDRG